MERYWLPPLLTVPLAHSQTAAQSSSTPPHSACGCHRSAAHPLTPVLSVYRAAHVQLSVSSCRPLHASSATPLSRSLSLSLAQWRRDCEVSTAMRSCAHQFTRSNRHKQDKQAAHSTHTGEKKRNNERTSGRRREEEIRRERRGDRRGHTTPLLLPVSHTCVSPPSLSCRCVYLRGIRMAPLLCSASHLLSPRIAVLNQIQFTATTTSRYINIRSNTQ